MRGLDTTLFIRHVSAQDYVANVCNALTFEARRVTERDVMLSEVYMAAIYKRAFMTVNFELHAVQI